MQREVLMDRIAALLANARKELAERERERVDAEHRHEIAKVRVETLEILDEEEIEQPARTDPAASFQGSNRAPRAAWNKVFASCTDLNGRKFSYDDVVAAAVALGVPGANKGNVRVRVCAAKKAGRLRRVSDGVYEPTPTGLKVFFGK
jgi:hypothetical protein